MRPAALEIGVARREDAAAANERGEQAREGQLTRLTHTAFQVVAFDPYLVLAERLDALVGKGENYKSILLATGAEAVENAVKRARFHQAAGRLRLSRRFHGRTLLGVSLRGFAQP